MTDKHSQTESPTCDPLLGTLHVDMLAFGDVVLQPLWLEHTRCTTDGSMPEPDVVPRRVAVPGTPSEKAREAHELTHLPPRILCFLNFVLADQHWSLRQTVRIWGHVSADFKHVTVRQLQGNSFLHLLFLHGVVLTQNDPAP